MKLNFFNVTVGILLLLGIGCISLFIYFLTDIQDIIVKHDDKPLPEKNEANPNEHLHNGESHAHDHGTEPNKPVNKLATETQEIGSSTATPIYGTDFDIEAYINSPEFQAKMEDLDKRRKDYFDNHPFFQPQAVADRKTISEYRRAETEFHRKYQELHEEWKAIQEENDKLLDISIEEFKKLSKEEQLERINKLAANREKMHAHREKEDAHNKTDPIYPAAAAKRAYELWESVSVNNQLILQLPDKGVNSYENQ